MRTTWLWLVVTTFVAVLSLPPAVHADPLVGGNAEQANGASKDIGPDEFPRTFYRYRKRGRWVFTNIQEQVPLDQRSKARLDLSHITLNSQLGAELDASMQHEFETLSATPQCRQAVAQKSHWLKPIWDEYNYLIILSAVFLALVLGTPYALRRVDAPAWARTLTKSFAMLGFVALFMHTSMRAGKTYEALSETAEPCERETWRQHDGKPQALPNKLKILMELQAMLQKSDQHRLEELDKLLK